MDGHDPAPERNAVLAGQQMVAASHPSVSAVGARVLADGGNAVDATIAMAAMCWLALPGQCGIGGDAFAVVRDSGGPVWTVGGSGFGPDGGEPEFYTERGYSAIPLHGALAVAAPGAIAALAALHQRAGTRSLAELWQPAITAAARGLPCTRKTCDDIAEHQRLLAADEGTSRMFLPGGRVPGIGDRLPYPEFAETLCTIADDPAALYRGELAQRAVAALRAGSAPFSGTDWELAGTATTGDAITGGYRDLLVHETPLPSPGWMVLQQAALCDGALGELPALSARAVGYLAAAARRAFHDRARRGGSDTEAWRDVLGPGAVAAARADIASG
ncbi:MAG: gamma-glutamyltransferase, partial [Sciscionella sp.]